MSLTVKIAIIALGGALGALARTGTGELMTWLLQRAWLGTFTANMLGCLGMGLARGAVEANDWGSPELRALVFAGFLGAFTTFSTFEADTVGLWQQGSKALAASYMIVSVLGGVGAFCLGWWWMTRGA